MALPNEEQTFLNQPIYNIDSKTGDIELELGDKDENEDKEPIRAPAFTPVTGSSVYDASAVDTQLQNLMRYDATTGEPYIDNFNMAADIYRGITTDIQNRRGSYSANNTTTHFSNVNEQNNNPFYKDLGDKTISGITTAADIYGKPFGGGPLGAFASGMVGTILGGGFPMATAISLVGYGLQQEKDKNNFIKKLKGGMNNLLNLDSDYKSQVPSEAGSMAFPYAGKSDMTTKQYMNHILFNSNNPGYHLKKYAQYGDTPKTALANFMNEGVDNGVFKQEDILKMGSSRHELQPGSDAYMKAWSAEQALIDKGYEVKGRVAIAPDGTQYLDGKVWTRSDLSGTIDKSKDESSNEPIVNVTPKPKPKPDPKPDTGPIGNPMGGQRDSGSGSGSGSKPGGHPGRETKSSSPPSGPNLTNRQEGGPIGNPMGEQQPQMPMQDAGNLEMVNEPNKDMSGVADDVPRELNEGDFVINAPAVEMAGRGDIERMVTKAITELQRKGIKLDFGQSAEDVDSIVKALVSNKEMIIPKVIAEQIGYDRLEKINNRGKERVNEIEEEQQAKQQQIQGNPQAQGMMGVQMGGQIALDENKNQPIAVPRESFAGQSSVGRKLLSPLSPESQNDEKELQEKSQSFEGFLKPIKLSEGDIVTRADRNNNPLNIVANDNTTSFFGVVGVDSLGDQPETYLTFDNDDNGLRAGAYILRKQYNNMTADEIINKFTRTDKSSYSQAIKNKFGNNKINTLDDKSLLELLRIMTNQEGTQKTFSDEQILNAIKESKIEK